MMTPTAELAQAAPERSLQQRRDALEHANEIRTLRAVLKRDIKAGRVDPVAVIANPPAYVATMKLLDLMLAMPKVGRVKANKILRVTNVSPSKTIGGLSMRQRNELVSLLPRSMRRFEAANSREPIAA